MFIVEYFKFQHFQISASVYLVQPILTRDFSSRLPISFYFADYYIYSVCSKVGLSLMNIEK